MDEGTLNIKTTYCLLLFTKLKQIFIFEIYETNVYREILGKDELESDTGTLVILKGLALYNVM